MGHGDDARLTSEAIDQVWVGSLVLPHIVQAATAALVPTADRRLAAADLPRKPRDAGVPREHPPHAPCAVPRSATQGALPPSTHRPDDPASRRHRHQVLHLRRAGPGPQHPHRVHPHVSHPADLSGVLGQPARCEPLTAVTPQPAGHLERHFTRPASSTHPDHLRHRSWPAGGSNDSTARGPVGRGTTTCPLWTEVRPSSGGSSWAVRVPLSPRP